MRSLVEASLFFYFFVIQSLNANETHPLPVIGDAASGVVALQKEKELGESWIKSLRRQVKIIDDPLINAYFKDLVYQIVPNSQLQDRQLQLIIVDSPILNAFAVPGGIIGINAGLFFHASTEQEFASVIAHELAHLSQRHYARNLEQVKNSAPLQMAGLLASIIIAATAGSDAGMAALAGTQAIGEQKQLSYSRQNEQEADRLGLTTLFRSGMNPEAMPNMFERMLQSNRYSGAQIPEYLSTHPITTSRIADLKSRAAQFPKNNYIENEEFYFMQARVLLHFASSNIEARQLFRAQIGQTSTDKLRANQYGLALSLIDSRQYADASKLIDTLLVDSPYRISLVIAKAKALAGMGKVKAGLQLLEEAQKIRGINYPLKFYSGKLYLQAGEIELAEKCFREASQANSKEPAIWYELAEAHGLAGNIVALHQARAEYYFLQGRYTSAISQLELASKKNAGAYPASSVIEQRLSEITAIHKRNRF
ncbi:MAG: hypothetical protein CSA50_03270 [Gammaproteobacteria bacterium]|nr:MAG: hypothetical protein CSA50_03270 [Gammaproteobacteria bacterium]